MSRGAGWDRADIDVHLLRDVKIMRLVRRLRTDQAAIDASVVLYLAIVLASWADGSRVRAADAVPLWWTDDGSVAAGHLRAVGLLDRTGRIPMDAWQSWFVPAQARREAVRAASAVANAARWKGHRRPPDDPPRTTAAVRSDTGRSPHPPTHPTGGVDVVRAMGDVPPAPADGAGLVAFRAVGKRLKEEKGGR